MVTRDEIKQRHYPFVAQAREDGWAIYFPDLPGCQTFASTWAEVGRKSRAIFEDWIDLLIDEGRPVPEPTIAPDNLPWDIAHFVDAPIDRFTTAEVSEQLGISVRRVQALAKARDLGRQQGRDKFFSAAEVENMRERRPGRPRGKE